MQCLLEKIRMHQNPSVQCYAYDMHDIKKCWQLYYRRKNEGYLFNKEFVEF